MLYYACLLKLYISGKARYSVTFPKGIKAWIAKPILEDKDYKHLTHMMEDIIQFRLHDKRHDMIEYDTPSTIPHNIATIERPPKQEVIALHTSRFPSHLQFTTIE